MQNKTKHRTHTLFNVLSTWYIFVFPGKQASRFVMPKDKLIVEARYLHFE